MPLTNCLGCFPKCVATQSEACRKREIEAYAEENNYQEGRLKKDRWRKHFTLLTPGPTARDQQKHSSSQRSASEQETAIEVGNVLEYRNRTVAGAKQDGASPEKGRARE